MAKKAAKKGARKSARRVGAKSPAVAVLAADIFEDLEAWYPILRLREAGVNVTVVGAKKGEEYTGKHGLKLKADIASSTARASSFDGVFIPGGYAPDKMRRDAKMVKLVRDIFNKGGLVASICHGPWVLCEADVLRGKNFTSVGAVKTDCVNAGGKFHNKPVIVDGNLITSRVPGDLPEMMPEVLKFLGVNG